MANAGGMPRSPPYLSLIYQGCYYCYKPQTGDTPFLRCSACRRVCYHSAECQKADWSEHKKLCKAYSKLQHSLLALATSSDEATHNTEILCSRGYTNVVNKVHVLQLILNRGLDKNDRGLVAAEPRCLACARSEEDIRMEAGPDAASVGPLITCEECKLSFYCSQDHREFAKYRHQYFADQDSLFGLSQCAMNQMIREDLVIRETLESGRNMHPPWVASRIKTKWESLKGKTWASEYEALMQVPKAIIGTALRWLSDDLSYPLTALWALEKLKPDDAWTRKNTLTIHILGPSTQETFQGKVFEELLHRLPEVNNLHLVLCGPEMALGPDTPDWEIQMPLCEKCTQSGRRSTHSHFGSMYHDWVAAQGDAYTPPDLAIGYNVGVGGDEYIDSWRPTIKLLVQKKVTSMFTSINRSEAGPDTKALIRAGARLVPALKGLNPWRSQWLVIEPTRVDGLFSHNMYVAGGFA